MTKQDEEKLMIEIKSLIKEKGRINRLIGVKFNLLKRVEMTPYESEIIRIICGEHGVGIDEVAGTSRYRIVSNARMAIVVKMKDELGSTFERIGRILGGRNYATIMYLYKKKTGKK